MVVLLNGLYGAFIGFVAARSVLWQYSWSRNSGTWEYAFIAAFFGCEGAVIGTLASALNLNAFSSGLLSSVNIGTIVFTTLSLWLFSKKQSVRRRWIVPAVGVGLIACANLLLIAYSADLVLHRGWLAKIISVNKWVFDNVGATLILVAILLIGGTIYIIRERQRQLYAIIEGLFGSLTAAISAINLNRIFDGRDAPKAPGTFSFEFVFAIFAGVSGLYVIVRAFDNYDKYLQEETKARRISNTQSPLTNQAAVTPNVPKLSDGWFADLWQRLRGKPF